MHGHLNTYKTSVWDLGHISQPPYLWNYPTSWEWYIISLAQKGSYKSGWTAYFPTSSIERPPPPLFPCLVSDIWYVVCIGVLDTSVCTESLQKLQTMLCWVTERTAGCKETGFSKSLKRNSLTKTSSSQKCLQCNLPSYLVQPFATDIIRVSVPCVIRDLCILVHLLGSCQWNWVVQTLQIQASMQQKRHFVAFRLCVTDELMRIDDSNACMNNTDRLNRSKRIVISRQSQIIVCSFACILWTINIWLTSHLCYPHYLPFRPSAILPHLWPVALQPQMLWQPTSTLNTVPASWAFFHLLLPRWGPSGKIIVGLTQAHWCTVVAPQ